MIEKLNLKDKDRIVRKIYKNYKKAQLDMIYMSQHYNYYPQIDLFKVRETSYGSADQKMLNQLEKKERLEDYVRIVNQIHSQLSNETFTFIENEYLNFYDINWYIPLYSKATYYRMKHKALNELLEVVLIFWDEEELMQL
ncbi:MAG: hypothetical protein K2P09_05655 [Erysipelotrichales bacterium]|nr:hypothetical protein [Erysipelotrichales bacterium]